MKYRQLKEQAIFTFAPGTSLDVDGHPPESPRAKYKVGHCILGDVDRRGGLTVFLSPDPDSFEKKHGSLEVVEADAKLIQEVKEIRAAAKRQLDLWLAQRLVSADSKLS